VVPAPMEEITEGTLPQEHPALGLPVVVPPRTLPVAMPARVAMGAVGMAEAAVIAKPR